MEDQWDCEIANYYVALPYNIQIYSSIRAFFEQVFRKIFWTLLGYTVTKAPASPRNLTWSTRPFLLVRGWGLGTRLGQSVDARGPVDHAGVGLAQARTNYIICTDKNSCDKKLPMYAILECSCSWSWSSSEILRITQYSDLSSTTLMHLCHVVGYSYTLWHFTYSTHHSLVIHLLTFWSAHLFVSRNWCTCLSPWVLNCTIQCT